MAGAPPPPPVFTIGGSSGGSSGSTTKKTTTTKKPAQSPDQSYQAQHIAQLQAIYEGLWGQPAQAGYLAHHAGLNTYEFEANERAKPAFKFSPRYQEEELQTIAQLGNRFGQNGYQ